MSCLPPVPRACGTRYRDRWLVRLVGASVGGLELRGLRPLQGVEGLLGHLALLVSVAFDGERDEDQGQDAEDEGLDGVEHHLKAEQADGDERDRQRGDDAECDLATVDVAEESHRERDGLDELEHQFHETDEERNAAGTDPVLELIEREELAEIAADAESAEPLELEVDEADEGQPEGDVHVARRGSQLLDPSDGRDEPAPVAEQDQQEERDEEWDVWLCGGPCDAEAEVAQELVEPLE